MLDPEEKLVHWNVVHRRSGGRKVLCDGSLANRCIYHMLPWPYALKIFEDGHLRLSPVSTWLDPFERWWCEILFNRTGALSGIQAYGICWTTGTYDEPRWRMSGFGREDPIVRIRCRVGAILEAGLGMIEQHRGSLFLGKVRYRRQRALVELAESVKAGLRKEVTRNAAALLIHKRSAFRFEHEVRLLWLDRQPPESASFFKIDPAAIDQVISSPHTSLANHQKIAAAFLPHKVVVKRSGILQAPAGL